MVEADIPGVALPIIVAMETDLYVLALGLLTSVVSLVSFWLFSGGFPARPISRTARGECFTSPAIFSAWRCSAWAQVTG